MPVREVLVAAVGDWWEEVRYCCAGPEHLKLKISRSFDRPLPL